MAAHDYPGVLGLYRGRPATPQRLVTRELTLEQAPDALPAVGEDPGIAVVTSF